MNFRKTSFFAVVLAVASLVLLACSAILGDFDVAPEGSSSSGGADTGVATDTGSSGNDSGPTADTGSSGGNDDAGDGSVKPKTFCDDEVAPPGAVQFLCADFDDPLLIKGWDDISRTDGGFLERTQDVAVSNPNAIDTTVTGGPAHGFLLWKRPGAKEFEEVTARVHINPGVLGGVVPKTDTLLDLVDIRTTNASVTFGYSRGSTVFGGAEHYGYYITNSVFGGAAAITHTKIDLAPAANVWTLLKIVWNRSGKIDVFYNNVSVFTKAGFSSADTLVNMRLGANADGNVGAMPHHRFDNAEFSIRRVP